MKNMEKVHKKRHLLLHQYLDELVADMVSQTGVLLSQITVRELMEWSYKQTKDPEETEKKFVPLPEGQSVKFNAGVKCDMKIGPCSCGAWHKAHETKSKVKTMRKPIKSGRCLICPKCKSTFVRFDPDLRKFRCLIRDCGWVETEKMTDKELEGYDYLSGTFSNGNAFYR
jgi:hypothetical protein